MNHLGAEMAMFYHDERPHQAKDSEPLLGPPSVENRAEEPSVREHRDVVPITDIGCRERLGGLLKHCYRKAA